MWRDHQLWCFFFPGKFWSGTRRETIRGILIGSNPRSISFDRKRGARGFFGESLIRSCRVQNIHPWRTRLWFNVGHTCRWNIFEELSTGLGTIQINFINTVRYLAASLGTFLRSGIVPLNISLRCRILFAMNLLMNTFKGNLIGLYSQIFSFFQLHLRWYIRILLIFYLWRAISKILPLFIALESCEDLFLSNCWKNFSTLV